MREAELKGSEQATDVMIYHKYTMGLVAAIAFADATSVMHAAADMSFRLSLGLAP